MRPKYSPVAPVLVLRDLFNRGLLENYILLLAQDVLAHPREYHDLIIAMRNKDQDTFVIMDNGTAELGNPLTPGEVIEAAGIVDASCVVSPDVIGSWTETKKLVMDHGDEIRAHYPLMLTPQGNSWDEIRECIDWLANRYPANGTPQYWGIPRWFANKFGTRQPAITYINNYTRASTEVGKLRIHLLGMSEQFKDDIHCAKSHSVMGIDSANPMVLAYQGRTLHDWEHLPRGTFWDATFVTEMMAHNMEAMRELLDIEPR